ncbi:MAG: hypothetical protein HOV96_09165 [Nonomuraea sp.]|nr:hypothetical protein [Nonomuraea sp.]NUP66034.1 hypothetical protein [Nonomuraea sp.]NUP77700.1 hypothetical protein [Nonomuraea sp.]NUS03931.1 hypothetical protein [Nonomuraea sp.]NUT44893.1 hypothetical protein [Thermoactinospora sp.]
MLKNHLRRDLQSLRRQARKDRRITLGLLAGLAAAWTRQLTPGDQPAGSGLLLALSVGLVAASGAAWLMSAYFAVRAVKPRSEPVEVLTWVSRVGRSKEWAFCSLAAYVAWHLLQFVTALVLG